MPETRRETTGEHIEQIAAKSVQRYQPGEELLPMVRDALMEFYELKFPGCRACADEGYHAARAEMLEEVAKMIEGRASRLWIKRQDNEAGYLRDLAHEYREMRAHEIAVAEQFGSGFHSCTLTGLHP